MNEPDFEQQLRSLHPAQPSAHLEAEVAAKLAVSENQGGVGSIFESLSALWRRVFPPLGWAGAGALATFMALAAQSPQPAAPQPGRADSPRAIEAAPMHFRSVGSSHQIVNAQDEGARFSQSDATRKVRTTSFEKIAWADPRTGAQLVVEFPREDIFLTPIAVQ